MDEEEVEEADEGGGLDEVAATATPEDREDDGGLLYKFEDADDGCGRIEFIVNRRSLDYK